MPAGEKRVKVAIAGYGAEGEINYQYWHSRIDPSNGSVTIVDEKHVPGRPIPEGVKVMLGENVFKHLDDYDLVVRTASLPPMSIKTNGVIWSATNEFLEHCPAPIIGVTGTKGKGTTSSLIAAILKAAGKTVHLVGNIGLPALKILPEIKRGDIVVFEMSSFQLWDAVKSPQVAVVLMVEPDHLDVHEDMTDYVTAKSNIRHFQKADDVCIYHPLNKYAKLIAESSYDGERVRYGQKEDKTVYAKTDGFYIEDYKLCPLDALQLKGAHNIENACAAISAARLFVSNETAIEQGLRAFTGLPHRLKFVRKVHNVDYYDDSIATTPGSAMAAIEAFEQPKVLILGGSDKGAEYENLIDTVSKSKSIRAVIAVGATGQSIAKQLAKKNAKHGLSVKTTETMREVVAAAAVCAQPGDVVLLSPASASFDQYRSYADRGDQFIAAAEAL